MSEKYTVMEERAKVGWIIHNGDLDYFVLAINGNKTLLQCISDKPDSFKNGEIIIASGLKKYLVEKERYVKINGKDVYNGTDSRITWMWDYGTYLSNTFMDSILADLLEPENSKANRMKVLLYNAISLLNEEVVTSYKDEETGHKYLLNDLGMTEEMYKEIMEEER